MALNEPQKSTVRTRLTSVRKLGSVFGSKGRPTLARGWMRRHVWIVPVLALVGLVFAATWVRSRIEDAMRDDLEGEMVALLNADVTALKIWLRAQEAEAVAAAEEPAIRQSIVKLAEVARTEKSPVAALLQSPQRAELAQSIAPWLETFHFVGYNVLAADSLVLAANDETLIGQKLLAGNVEMLDKVIDKGKPLVSPPFASLAMLEDEWGQRSPGVPTMFAASPVRDDEGKIVAVLGLRMRPDKEFTNILNVARPGQTGETYAINRKGVFLSASRFEDELKRMGLQVDRAQSRSVLEVEVRNPGVDMRTGARPEKRRSEQPLTKAAQSVIEGGSGVDVEGYPDYRGVPNVGAWTWLDDYGFGVITEMDKDEAFRPLTILRTAFWTLFGLLAAAAGAMLGLTLLAGRLERRVREAVIAAGQLGQYALEEKIGEGGMGSVYRGRHAMLRRPTAVKLLEPAKTTEMSIARFEREVQLTSQLNHPNTITIYDYGRTPEGVFYYAMEFLDGFSLDSLVEHFGPQGDGRVINILLQVCGSLVEAHTAGLIHRDIKPANIMLTRRGGVCDFVKLLDFGLVKALDATKTRA